MKNPVIEAIENFNGVCLLYSNAGATDPKLKEILFDFINEHLEEKEVVVDCLPLCAQAHNYEEATKAVIRAMNNVVESIGRISSDEQGEETAKYLNDIFKCFHCRI